MKKIILQTSICIFCLVFATSCSKNVKSPAKKTTATTNTTVSTKTQNQNQTQTTTQQGHTCNGGSSSGNNGQNGTY
ncbi:MAG TPA: hypothetical protein VHB70_13755 [Parafilimonas sp.]|nr:hypothetical protein [Parafilimonas sp.]